MMINNSNTFSLSQEGLFLLEKTTEIRISNYLKISNIIINKNTNIETYKLEYRRRNSNDLHTSIQIIYKKIRYYRYQNLE